MTTKKIYIIGESHTRQFTYRNNIFPIFMGNGKNINLNHPEILNSNIKNIISKLKSDDAIFCLYLGEPNCRIKLRGHWAPHWDDIRHGIKIDSTPDRDYLDMSLDNYKKVDLSNIDFVISPTGAYDPVIPSLKYLNEGMENLFGEKYINIFKFSIDKNNKVLQEYKAKDWKADPIHLNSRICDRFLEEMLRLGVISDVSDYENQIDGYFGIHMLRCADKSKFGSFIMR